MKILRALPVLTLLVPALASAQTEPSTTDPPPAPAASAPAASAPAPVTTAPTTPPPLEPAKPVPLIVKQEPERRAFVDYSDGNFYLRDSEDRVVFQLGGRVHIDTYAFAGPGVQHYQRPEAQANGRLGGTGLQTNMAFRRFIIEIGGTYAKRWYFWIGGNFAPSQLDFNQNPQSSAMVYDGYVGYEADPLFRIQAGQFNTPFTMENVTSSRWLDFMERSLTSRAVGAPYNKDLGIMAMGDVPSGIFSYMIGVFGGDGMNRPSPDTRVDGVGRVVLRPLSSMTSDLKNFHIGGSFRYGRRDPDYVYYDANALSTPGGYAFWQPVYGKGATETHIIPSGTQLGAGAELYVPIERVDLKAEVIYVRDGRREAFINNLYDNERYGFLTGYSGYAQLSFWPIGTPRVNGQPGTFPMVRPPKDRGREAPYGLQIALRYEMLRLRYDSNGSDNDGYDPGFLDSQTNKITVNAYQAAVTYWATKHVRLTAQYSLYQFPGTPTQSLSRTGEFPPLPPGREASNQAAAPGARANAFDFDANHFHELSFRFGLAL